MSVASYSRLLELARLGPVLPLLVLLDELLVDLVHLPVGLLQLLLQQLFHILGDGVGSAGLLLPSAGGGGGDVVESVVQLL